MILHTVNKSPFTTTLLQECLTVLGSRHSVLLIEDGVYGALGGHPAAAAVMERSAKGQNVFYALVDDLRARGLQNDPLLESIKTIDYGGFVDLVARHHSVQSWF